MKLERIGFFRRWVPCCQQPLVCFWQQSYKLAIHVHFTASVLQLARPIIRRMCCNCVSHTVHKLQNIPALDGLSVPQGKDIHRPSACIVQCLIGSCLAFMCSSSFTLSACLIFFCRIGVLQVIHAIVSQDSKSWCGTGHLTSLRSCWLDSVRG
jgi:hypothetical protein